MMYMVRHMTQLPVTTGTIAKAEGIPTRYLSKIFELLAKEGFIRPVGQSKKGYVFARDPQDISLLELFHILEGEDVFDDCFMRHCACGQTPQTCDIYAKWRQAASQLRDFMSNTDLAEMTWGHPEHRLDELAPGRNVKGDSLGSGR
jgi:Rrf2 family protein